MNIIKDQMQTFREKMKKESTHQQKETFNESINSNFPADSIEMIKPQVKPRTKLFKPTGNELEQQQLNSTSLTTKLDESILQIKTTQSIQGNQEVYMKESNSKQRESALHFADSNHTEDEIIEIKAPKHTKDNSSSETEYEGSANSVSDVQSVETKLKKNKEKSK